jgi:mono/diheme cytochrome c family protein
MYKAIFYTHIVSVILFLLIYLVKTILLVSNNYLQLDNFKRKTKVPEMIISFLFLLSGIYMLFQIPEINTLLIVKIALVFASIPLAVIGFKKNKKALAVLSLLMIIMAYGLAEMSKKKMSKPEVAVSEVETDGKAIYNVYCTKCHGDDGKLGLMGAKDLSVSTLDHTGMKDIIANGKGAMAGFKNQLNDMQIEAVTEYLHTFKGN